MLTKTLASLRVAWYKGVCAAKRLLGDKTSVPVPDPVTEAFGVTEVAQRFPWIGDEDEALVVYEGDTDVFHAFAPDASTTTLTGIKANQAQASHLDLRDEMELQP